MHKIGRFGPFIARAGFLTTATAGRSRTTPRCPRRPAAFVFGTDVETGLVMTLRSVRYGRYSQWGESEHAAPATRRTIPPSASTASSCWSVPGCPSSSGLAPPPADRPAICRYSQPIPGVEHVSPPAAWAAGRRTAGFHGERHHRSIPLPAETREGASLRTCPASARHHTYAVSFVARHILLHSFLLNRR